MRLFQIIITILFLFLSFNDAHAVENLLKNPDFEDIKDNLPVGWRTDTWIKDKKTTDFSIIKDKPFNGKNAVSIIVKEPDDSKILQDITVEPNSLYFFSCKIRAEGIPTDSKGANISVLGILQTSDELYDTKRGWKDVSFYGQTGNKQTSITFSLRIGGYGRLNKGKADFDDCVIKKVNVAPPSIKVINLFTDTKKQDTKKASTWGINSVFFVSLLYLILAVLLINNRKRLEIRNPDIIFLSIITVGFIIRIVLSYNSTGFPVDINTYKAWAEYLATKGFSDFYTAGHFIDYPPLYMYIFYVVGKLRIIFNLPFDSDVYNLIMKLPSLIAEIVSMCLLIFIANKRGVSTGNTIISLSLFAFNPVIIIDSALWGQIDSFLALFILGFLAAMVEKRIILATFLFALSLMIKPQSLVFVPLFAAYVVSLKDLKVLSKVCLTFILTVFPLLIPFSLAEGFIWIPKLLKTMFTEYPFATLNTFNFYALIGKNWAPIDDSWLFLSFRAWGFISVLVITILCIYLYIKSKDEHKILFIALITIASVFMFSVKMHERYMVTSMVIFALAYILSNEKKVLYLFIAFTITNTFNLGYPLILAHKGIYHIDPRDFMLRAFSLANLFIYILTLKWFIPKLLDIKSVKSRQDKIDYRQLFKPKPSSVDLSLGKRDVISVSIIFIFFSILYFFNLGSTTSPQTYWQPKAKGEAFIIDFKMPQDISRINYFGGIGKGAYRIDTSDDLFKWQSLTVIEPKDVFQWKHINVNTKTRYLSIVVVEPESMLYEIGFFDTNKRLIRVENPINIISSPTTVGTIKNLFDEQEKVPYSPSYKNGTYFDEIYYARTAFEYIHGLMPYEITHPPLGKLLIAGGIKIFGMTPFGWRFMGTLSGLVIIVFVFLMGRMLFGKTEYGIASAIIIGFDFMLFVQSRLTTIDSFSVMFIVMMTYFIIRFYFADTHRLRVINLTLSAISFSLGVATKWLCIYTGAGLALVFFYKLYQLSKKADIKKYILYGFLLFVMMPVFIYSITYLIILPKPIGLKHISTIVESQYHMYQYHKSIKSSHPFASTWWQWPIIYKPMWLYMAPDMLKGQAGSIVTMGNPLVWWAGLLTFLTILFMRIKEKIMEPVLNLIIIFIAANYLPWVLVPRETYIYHFFATTPFWILSIVYLMKHLYESQKEIKYFRYLPFVYLTIIAFTFFIFYPILSGLIIDKSYIRDYLQWFNTWVFFVPD